MFLSSINLFGNTCSVWNISQLRKVLKIPDDQLKVLNCIPGWLCSVEENPNKSPTTPQTNNKNLCELSVGVNKKRVSQESLKFFEDSGNINFEELNSLLKNCERQHLLKKSLSLSYLNNFKIAHSEVLKRSSSFPNMNESLILTNSSPTKHFKFVDIQNSESLTKSSLMKAPNVEVANQYSTSEFVNCAVQCQMSQSSQSCIENSNPEKVIHPSISTSVCQESDAEESTQLCSVEKEFLNGEPNFEVIESQDNKNESPSMNCLRKEEGRSVNVTDIEESFVSQPIPCAQPLQPNESITMQKLEQLSAVKESSLALSNHDSVKSQISKASTEIDKRNNQNASKRKRKIKTEKTKKFRGISASEIDIRYSSDQIKHMIEFIKIFNKF